MINQNWISKTIGSLCVLSCAAAPLSAVEKSEAAQFEAIAKQLDVGGTYFQITDAQPLMEMMKTEVVSLLAQIAAQNQEAKPVADKIKLFLERSGCMDVQYSGQSTMAIQDAQPLPLYCSKSILQLKENAPLWQAIAPANLDLTPIIAAMPASTVCMLTWNMDAVALQPLLEEALADLDESDKKELPAILQALTGRVDFAVFKLEDGQYAFYLSLPDSANALFQLKDAPQFSWDTADGRMSTFFDLPGAKEQWQKQIAEEKLLIDTETFSSVAHVLPDDAVSALYFDGDMTWLFEILCKASQKTFNVELYKKLQMPVNPALFSSMRRDGNTLYSTDYCHLDIPAFLAAFIGHYLIPGGVTIFNAMQLDAPMMMPQAVAAENQVSAMKQLGLALQLYALDNNEQPYNEPDVLTVLAKDNYFTADVATELEGMLFLAAPASQSPQVLQVVPRAILLDAGTGNAIVLYADGSVETVSMPGIGTMKEVVSILHSRKQMPPMEFQRLIQSATNFDVK